jgi:hypothetical protein
MQTSTIKYLRSQKFQWQILESTLFYLCKSAFLKRLSSPFVQRKI